MRNRLSSRFVLGRSRMGIAIKDLALYHIDAVRWSSSNVLIKKLCVHEARIKNVTSHKSQVTDHENKNRVAKCSCRL